MRQPAKYGAPGSHGLLALYATCQPDEGSPVPAAVVRNVKGRHSMSDAIELLLAGLTPDERAAGFESTFGESTAGIDFMVESKDGVATVDFDKRILDVKFMFVSVNDVAQIASTLAQFPGIDWVSVQVGGEPFCKPRKEC